MDLTPAEDPIPSGNDILANMRSAMRLIEGMTTVLLCPEGEGERVERQMDVVKAEYPFARFEVWESAHVPAGKVSAFKKSLLAEEG